MTGELKEGSSIRLWTWQGRGFDITGGRADHTASPYATEEPILRAYAKLNTLVGTDQWI